MRLITLTNKFIFALVWLSIVVHVTDSCSSFNGWKRRDPDKKSKKTSSTTLPPVIVDRPCPTHLERELCLNGGRCVLRLEPTCECALGWTGKRCMDKVTDGNYDVKVKNQTHESSTTPVTSTEAITESTNRPDLIDFPIIECPSPWKEEFCLNGGICSSINHGFHFMCSCIPPFTGQRCSEKALDGSYSGLVRPKRDLSSVHKLPRKPRKKKGGSRKNWPPDDPSDLTSTNDEPSSE